MDHGKGKESNRHPACEPESDNTADVALRPSCTEKELVDAWRELDLTGRGSLGRWQALRLIKQLFPSATHETATDMAGRGSMSYQKLHSLAQVPCQDGYDPAAAAFSILDPCGQGEGDVEVLQRLMLSLGVMEQFDEEDRKVMLQVLDADCDGVVSLEDFRQLEGGAACDSSK